MKFEISNRKELVNAISEITGVESKYLRTPSCAYMIGEFIVEKDGSITCEDNAKLDELTKALLNAGFVPEGRGQSKDNCMFSISVPADKVNVNNLKTLLSSKKTLIKKALGTSNIRIRVNDDKVIFPWFDFIPTDVEVDAYTKFIAAVCKLSLEQKRVNKKSETKPENEKYAFRCFLLRLGFIGAEYKDSRKILLQNLSGSSAFRTK